MIAKTLIIQKGEPRVSGDMPPVEPEMGFLTDIEQFAFRDKKKAFIKNSVVVGNWTTVSDKKLYLKVHRLYDEEFSEDIVFSSEDGFYPLPEGITYEVKDSCPWNCNGEHSDGVNCLSFDAVYNKDLCKQNTRVAILTFAPKEKLNNNAMMQEGIECPENQCVLSSFRGRDNNRISKCLAEGCILKPAQEKGAGDDYPIFEFKAQEKDPVTKLEEFIDTCPKEEMDAILKQVEGVGTNGPTVDEYFQGLGGQYKNITGANSSFIPPPLINTTGANNAQEEPIKKYDNGASWAVGKFDPDHLKYQISNLDQEEKSAEEVKPDFEKQYHEDKLESRQRIIDSQYQEISALQEENKALKERLEMYLNSF